MIQNGKAKIDNSFNSLSISIPSKKNWLLLLFGTAWLGGWYFGFKNASSILIKDGIAGANSFLAFWLIAWTVGGTAIVFMLLWGYFGHEKIASDRSQVKFSKAIFGIGIKRTMDFSQITNIRAEVTNGNWMGRNGLAIWGLGPGKIKFDYGLKTFSFGLGVDDAEANYIAEIMKAHFKK